MQKKKKKTKRALEHQQLFMFRRDKETLDSQCQHLNGTWHEMFISWETCKMVSCKIPPISFIDFLKYSGKGKTPDPIKEEDKFVLWTTQGRGKSFYWKAVGRSKGQSP